MASQVPPKKATAFNLGFSLYKNDGTLITNPTTMTAKISKDFGDYADIGTVSEEDSTYGQLKLALTTAEMNADVISIYAVDATTGCVPYTCTIYTSANIMDDIKTDTAAILDDTGTNGVLVSSGTGTGQIYLSSGIVRAYTDSGAKIASQLDVLNTAITHEKLNTSTSLVYGSTDSGSDANIDARDGVLWTISEDATNGLQLDMVFPIEADHRPGSFDFFGYYSGSGTHFMNLWVYNEESDAWEILANNFIPNGGSSSSHYSAAYYEQHVDRVNNQVQFRLKHNVVTYNATHDLVIDKISITNIEITSTLSTDAIADAVWDEDLSAHTDAGTGGLLVGTNLDDQVSEAVTAADSAKQTSAAAAINGFLAFLGVDWSESDALSISATGDLQTGDAFKIAVYGPCAEEGKNWYDINDYEWFEVFKYTHGTGTTQESYDFSPGNHRPYTNLGANDVELIGFCWDSPPRDPMPAITVTVTPKTGSNAGEPITLYIPSMEGNVLYECPLFANDGTMRRKDPPFQSFGGASPFDSVAGLPTSADIWTYGTRTLTSGEVTGSGGGSGWA